MLAVGPVLAALRLLAQVAALLGGRFFHRPVALRRHCLDEVAALVIYSWLEVGALACADGEVCLERALAVLLARHKRARLPDAQRPKAVKEAIKGPI